MPFTAASPVSAPVSAAPARTPAATRNPPAAPRGTSSSPARSSPQKAAARTWSTAPGESLESLGEALYPDDRSARERFRAATAAANPGLFPDPGAYDKALPAGTRVVIPNMRQVANAAPAKTRTPTATRAMRAVAVQTEQKTEDRVIVDKADAPPPHTRAATSASPHAIRPEAGDRSADLLGRERDLAAAIDRSIIAEMELLARIKELEDVQTQLEARIRAIAATATTAATAPPATALPRLAASTTATPALEPAETKDNSQDLYLFAGMGIAALLLALALLRKRSTTTSSKTPLLEHRAQHLRVVDTPSDTKVLRRGHASSEDTSFAGGFGMPASQQAPEQARVLPRKAASGGVEEPAIEEHKSAVELAEIMMSFGRVQGAAETLAEFVRSNPREAVAPWLKLLEVYRAAGLRAEFETIAGELNKTFNVITVGWSNYESLRDARASLEDLPHISETIQKSWGTSVCQRYLQHLLHDNRDGTRQGFPISTGRRDSHLVSNPRRSVGTIPKCSGAEHDGCRTSDRIVEVDELGFKTERIDQVSGNRLRAVALGGMVAGRDVGHARFARQMHCLLGDLARHIEISPSQDRLLEVALCATGTPGDPLHGALAVTHQ